MKKKIIIVSILCFSLLLTGCVKEAPIKDGKKVVASVKGKKVTADELYSSLKEQYGSVVLMESIDNYIASKEIEDDSNAKKEAESYINSLKENYESQGYDWNSILTQNGITSEKQLIQSYTNYYLKDEVAVKYIKDNITDEEIEKYYKDNIIGNITARHILIKPEEKEDMTDEEKEKALEKAYEKTVKIIKELDDGKKFSTLAKKYSDDTASAEEGGLLTAFNKQSNLVSEFIDAADELKVGKYSSEPVKSQYGYHIIYIESKDKKPKLKEVKDTIIDAIVEEKKQNDTNYSIVAWSALREKYNLEFFDTILKENYEKSLAK